MLVYQRVLLPTFHHGTVWLAPLMNPKNRPVSFQQKPSPKKAMCALRTESSIIDHLCRILKARDNVYSCTADNFGRIRDDLFLYEQN